MGYFQATREGQRRMEEAQKLLTKFAGYAKPAIFLKRGVQEFEPVGEEDLFSIVEINPGTVMIALVDSEGNAKAISSYMGKIRGQEVIKQIEGAGIRKYEGNLNLPV